MNSSTSASAIPTNGESSYNDKNIKRKFEDAIQTLDEAVGPLEPLSANPPPTKKLKTGRSLYAILTKYGIRKDPKPSPDTSSDKLDSLSKTAPNLTAIIRRTSTRARKALPFKFGHQPTPSVSSSFSLSGSNTSPESEYRPSSTTSFLSRLATFKLTTYANKPQAIDAVAASKCGWINNGKDRLFCGICSVSWVIAGKEGMSRDAANALIEKQRQSLVDMHKDGCPWKAKQCDPSIYRVPLYAPVAMARELKSRAEKLEVVMQGVEIRHPLTASQVQASMSTIKHVRQPSFSFSLDDPFVGTDGDAIMRDETPSPEHNPDLSEPAVLTSLFGWSILPSPEKPSSHPPSVSRAGSVAPSPVRLIRTASSSSTRESTPSPTARTRHSLSQRSDTSMISTAAQAATKQDSTVLHCTLCQRRIGLWAFIPPQPEDALIPLPTPEAPPTKSTRPQPHRQLDILKEHRSYCPYVIRSTELPSLPVPQLASRSNVSILQNGSTLSLSGQTGAAEGWRAVLTIVLRYGVSQRQRFGLGSRPETPFGSIEEHSGEAPSEVSEVEAMVAGVKSHGGRELLKYVKSLLG